MNLIERTAIELSSVIEAIVLKRTTFTTEEVAVIYGSEAERQAQARALFQRTSSGKTWLELIGWSKIAEVAQKNDAAHHAMMAYKTLVDDNAIRVCESFRVIDPVAALPEFWSWCKQNQVIYIPMENPDHWMACLLDESQWQRIEHEFAAMYRKTQLAA